MTEYHTLQELQELAVQQKKEIWQIVQQEDMDASERTQEQSYEKMHQMYEAMKNCMNTMRPGKISAVLLSVSSWKKQSKWANPMRV